MRFTSALRPARARVAAVCALALVATGIAIVNSAGAKADEYPGQSEIAAAREAATSQAASVADLDAAVASLEKALSDAEANQLLAADRYATSQGELDDAKTNLVTANERAAEAERALEEARNQLAAVAQAAYQGGGDMNQIGAVVTADGFEQAIASSEVVSRASDELATIVQRVEAAQLVADTLRDAADAAATRAEAAEKEAARSYDVAVAAADAAETAVREANTARDAAVARLTELNGTTVALEQARQEGLQKERDKKRQEDAKKAQQEAEEQAGGSAGEPKPKPKPTETTQPKPTQTPKPEETSKPQETKEPEPEPKPTETQAPKPPTTSGGWKSTASQGEQAVTKALTLMGLPYKLGGAGPSAYDCSGLTMTAWKAAGITIQRSSQMQYNSTKHVAFSQLRKGDLIFYGTNRDPKKIYHVAIYVGNGMVAEATKPGSLSVVRAYDASWRIDNLIPVVGRP